MICGTQSLFVVNGCPEGNKEDSSDKETYMSTASTEDVATDYITDDDEETPPMLTLERDTTLTMYHEISSNEWQPSTFIMPCLQAAEYKEQPPPPTVVMPCDHFADHMVPPPPPFPATLSMPCDVGNQLSAEVAHTAALSAPTYGSSQIFDQPSNTCHQENQLQSSFQGECVVWPPHDANQESLLQFSFQEEIAKWHPHDGNQSQDNNDLSDHLLAGGVRRGQALAALRGQVVELAFQQSGCRIVQQAIQVAGTDDICEILIELQGHIYAAARSPYANYVIQKLIEALPPSLSSLVAHELCGKAGFVARNKYGCRILCRLFEHSAAEPGSRTLADELLREAVALSRHEFAHHVMQVILAHGLVQQRQRIVNALLAEFWSNAHDQNSSYVIESAMVYCAEAELAGLVAVISAGSSERVASLLRGKAGNRVLRSLPKMPAQLSRHVLHTVVGKLQASESVYVDNRYAKRLVQELTMDANAAIAA